ncbi:protein kinase, putative [Plasmodium knowlesi strain H]|uniref:Protein kinase, putative n=3 Tax=Plasmodium knowlesi TaxID=5850 RepID=A0A5K1UAP1_PLAKH|nr:protein kinase, putative [Plasmodium knowlesi strain H]OTN68490.1 putative Protein kinase [Plasmodium knowlesi]CAA9986625.1 protein kinase, putative [Plasmodium knowlesi strain H]SBO24095.1 protein kinase, putative [Plasmodium knowlesi strain H]SBO29336.1 protein kinase, putative [Plasmodium knowlesi strain H]VVS76099.1 protein kinase, putative [Plasmodium knowlesi strain H]|eukprot:XP_002261165.1 protein kinase, putative [Plasmodium knowlesi strain H]
MYFCRRGDMLQHVDNTYTNHFKVERDEVSGVNWTRFPHYANRVSHPFEDHADSHGNLAGLNRPHFKRANLREDNSYLNANSQLENNSSKMGQKNAKTNNEGIFHLSNDAYNSRYSNLPYNHTGEMNPRNYNFNNIKIVEDDENYSCSMNPVTNVAGGKMGNHPPNGSTLDHRNFQLKSDDINTDHGRPHQDYARVNRENWVLPMDHNKGNGTGPYHHMFNNEMDFLTPNRVSNQDTQSPNANNNPGNFHPHQYKQSNRMVDDKYEELKNKWQPPPSYHYGNVAPPVAGPPTASSIAPPVGIIQKNKADLYDNAGKTNSPPYGNHFNMNTLYGNFNNNASQWKDMTLRQFTNKDRMYNGEYEGGGNYHGNHINSQPDASTFLKNKPPDIDDIIKKYTEKENQEDNFKFNWGYGKNEVTGREVFKGDNKHRNMNDGHVRNYLLNEDRIGNHANSSPSCTPQHNALYTFNQNGGYLPMGLKTVNTNNGSNPTNSNNPGNDTNVVNVPNGGSTPLVYPNFSSLRNKEKDEEEKKREKKINLLKNIIVTNPNPKYNFSFSDDLFESLPAHENNYLNTSSLADFNHVASGNRAHQGQDDILGERLQNRLSAHNNTYEDFNTPEKLNETPCIRNRHHFKSEVIPGEEDCYADMFGLDRPAVGEFGGNHFGVRKYGVDNFPRDNQPHEIRGNDENFRYEKQNADREFSQNPFLKWESNKNSNHALRDRDKNGIKLYEENFKQRGATTLGAFSNNTRLHTMADLHSNQENKPPPLIDILENKSPNLLGEKTFVRKIDPYGKMDKLDYFKKFENSTNHVSENVFGTPEGGGRVESTRSYNNATQHGGIPQYLDPAQQGDAFSNINSMNIFKTHAKGGDNYEEGSMLSKNPLNGVPKHTKRYLQEDFAKPSNNLFNMENIFQSDKRNGFLNEVDKFPFVRNEGLSHRYMFERERNPHLDLSIRENKNFTYRDDKDMIRRPYFDKSGRTMFEPYDDPTLRPRQYDHLNVPMSNNWDVKKGGNYRDAFIDGDNFRNKVEHGRGDEHVGTIYMNKNDKDGLFSKSNFHFIEKKNSTNFGEVTTPTGRTPIRDEPTKEHINQNSHYDTQRRVSKPSNTLFNNYHSTVKTNPMHDHPTGVTSNQHWVEGRGLHNFARQQNESAIGTKSYLENEQDENKETANRLKQINPPSWKYEASQNVVVPTSNISFQTNFNQINNDAKKNMLGGNRDGDNGVLNGGANWRGNHNNFGTTDAKAFLGILSEEQNRYSNLLNTVGRYTPRDGTTGDGIVRDGTVRDGTVRDGTIRDGTVRDINPRDGHNLLSNYTNKRPFNPSGVHNFSFAKQPVHRQLPPLPFKHSSKQANPQGDGQTKLKALDFMDKQNLGEGGEAFGGGGNTHLDRFNHGHLTNQTHNTHSGNENLLKNSLAPLRDKNNPYLGPLAELTPFDRYNDGKDVLQRRADLFHHKNESKDCGLKSGNVKFSNYLSGYPDQSSFLNEKKGAISLVHRNGKSKYSHGESVENHLGEPLSGKLLGGNTFLNKEKEDAPKGKWPNQGNLNLSLVPGEADRRIRNLGYDRESRISLSNNISMLLERISNNSDRKNGLNDFATKHKSSDSSNVNNVNTVNYNDNLTIDTQQFVISDHHICNFGLWRLYRCKVRHDKGSFLVSIVDSFYLNRGDSNDTVANNILFHKRLRHINILSYQGKAADKNKLYLLFEHVHGNVLKYQSAPLEENIIACYAYQIVDLLEYMHTNFIFFHGLLSNIIILQKNTREELLQILHERNKNVNKYFDIYKHGIVKVFNFDFANMDATEKDYQFDFLCLAVLIYEMCTKYNTYYSSKFEDITERIYNTDFFFPHFVSFELKNFCYELCSKRRHSFSDLKNHAWFQKNLNF